MTSIPVQRTECDVGSRSGYGYSGVRIYHHVVIRELSSIVAQARIPVIVNSRSETLPGGTWAFAKGRTRGATYPHRADILQHCGVTTYIPTSQISLETTAEQYSLPVIIMNQTHSAFMIAGGRVAGRSTGKDLSDLGAQ
ncbi:FAD dependent oxidoreductase [Penicillium viridicatum]|nr:FAD dependent oxidoreductase [Penicillium viridicatum]